MRYLFLMGTFVSGHILGRICDGPKQLSIAFVFVLFALLASASFKKQRAYALIGLYFLSILILGFIHAQTLVVDKFGSHDQPLQADDSLSIYRGIVCKVPIAFDAFQKTTVCVDGKKVNHQWARIRGEVDVKFFGLSAPKEGDDVFLRMRIKQDKLSGKLQSKISSDDRWAWASKSLQSSVQSLNLRAKYLLDPVSFQIYQAITLGRSQLLPYTLKRQWRDMGIIHLFVFSGFHVGVLFGVLYFMFSVLGVFWEESLRSKKKLCLFLAWICTSVFVFVNLSIGVPTFRAWIFLTVFISGVVLDVRKSKVFLLACALFASFMMLPEKVFEISSLLSFFAVSGIIWSLAIDSVSASHDGPKGLWVLKVRQSFVVCMGAFLWTTPILVCGFLQCNLMSFVYNFLLVPTVGMALVIAALLLRMSLEVPIDFLQEAIGFLYKVSVQAFIGLSDFIYLPKVGVVRVESFPVWVCALLYGSLIITYLYIQNQSKNNIYLQR